MRDRLAIGRRFRRILGNCQGQRIIILVQRVRVPSVNQRIRDCQSTIFRGRILHRDRSAEVCRTFRQQVRASFRVSRNCNREGRGPVNRTQVVDQRCRSSRLAQVEVDHAAFERGHDRTVRKRQMSAENRTVQQIHFTPRCDVRVFRTPVTRHHHHVVRIKCHSLRLAVAAHLNRAVAYRMHVLRYAAAAHNQTAAVHQGRLARQAAIRYHQASKRCYLRLARYTTAEYLLNTTDNLRVKR